MRKHVIFTAIAVAAVLFTACESVEIPAPDSGNAIEFRALVDKNGSTKASLVESVNELTSFFVTAWNTDNSSVTFMESAVWRIGAGQTDWEYSPKKYFPVDNDGSSIPVNFYAYAPIKDVNMGNDALLTYNGSDDVSFDYEVPYDQSESNTAVDLLVASVLGATGDPTTNSNQVAFIFEHALSGVTFSAKNNNPTSSELVFVISRIEITNLSYKGTFSYENSWSEYDSDLKDYIAGLPASGVSLIPNSNGSYTNLLSDNDIMMVLPQEPELGVLNQSENPEDKNFSFVKVTFSLKDGSGAFVYDGFERYLPLPDGFTFDPGMLYNFQFQFKAMNAITFDVTLKEWAIPNPSDTNLN